MSDFNTSTHLESARRVKPFGGPIGGHRSLMPFDRHAQGQAVLWRRLNVGIDQQVVGDSGAGACGQ